MLLLAVWNHFLDIIGGVVIVKLAIQGTRYWITGKWDLIERRPRPKVPSGAVNLTR